MSNEDSNQVLYKILIERLEQLRTMDKEGARNPQFLSFINNNSLINSIWCEKI